MRDCLQRLEKGLLRDLLWGLSKDFLQSLLRDCFHPKINKRWLTGDFFDFVIPRRQCEISITAALYNLEIDSRD